MNPWIAGMIGCVIGVFGTVIALALVRANKD